MKGSRRLFFPEEEGRLPWLPRLLESYAILDEGVEEVIRREAERGRPVVCSEGCSNCCRALSDIPVYPHEMVGIYWFSNEKTSGALRQTLKGRLLSHEKGGPCPFLIEGSCSVYPMRPASCRQFYVFDKVCLEGEDPYHTRRQDVLEPLEEYVGRAFHEVLPFYGVTDEGQKARVIRENLIHTQAVVVQHANWKGLANLMEASERENP